MTWHSAMSRLATIAVRLDRAVQDLQQARAACWRGQIPAAEAQPSDRTNPENPGRRLFFDK